MCAILEVLVKIKGGKATGKNGVLLEVSRCCDVICWIVLLNCPIVCGKVVPQEQRAAFVVPIPRKGSTSDDEWLPVKLGSV